LGRRLAKGNRQGGGHVCVAAEDYGFRPLEGRIGGQVRSEFRHRFRRVVRGKLKIGTRR
jgi:hypothetical protein